MNTKKTSNLLRLIAFFLTGVILVCTFGFTVDGWSADKDTDNGGPTPPPDVENPDIDAPPSDTPAEVPREIFYNRLTGLETTEELSNKAPVAYIMDKNAPSFGLSGADIIIDIPTEKDNRIVAVRTDNDSLWKIGSISPSRGYISNLACFFGASIISLGTEDIIQYDSVGGGIHYDLSVFPSSFYSEYDSFSYSNSDLLGPVIKPQEINASLPYAFAEIYEEITFDSPMASLSIEGSELIFDEELGNYLWYENSEQKRDLINGKPICFTNCLILFADSTIYDNTDGCQMVMNTVGSGEGYYLTNCSFTEVRWSSSISGNMTLYNANGEQLILNRGSIYIRYVKSSMKEKFIVN